MHQQDMLIFFEYQRQIFGICPCCGDFFRLSDTKIYKDIMSGVAPTSNQERSRINTTLSYNKE